MPAAIYHIIKKTGNVHIT